MRVAGLVRDPPLKMFFLPHAALRVALGLALASAGLAQPAAPQLTLTLQQAIDRAKQYGPSFLAANLAAASAHEDAVQARAALLPVSALSASSSTRSRTARSPAFSCPTTGRTFTTSRPSCTATFIAGKARRLSPRAGRRSRGARQGGNRGARPGGRRGAELLRNGLGRAQARQCPAEPARGAAVPRYHRTAGARRRGGALRVVKAQIQVEQRQRDAEERQLGLDKARLGFAVLLFPDFRQDFTVVDDLDSLPAAAPSSARCRSWPGRKSRYPRRPGHRGAAEVGNQIVPRRPAAHAIRRLFFRHQCQPVRHP